MNTVFKTALILMLIAPALDTPSAKAQNNSGKGEVRKLYEENCAGCHGADLAGGSGSSLIDDEWIHGGQSTDIIRTIMEGVPAMGMVPWQGILSPEQINQVAAYVISKHSEATGRSVEEIVGEGDEAEGSQEPAAEDPVG